MIAVGGDKLVITIDGVRLALETSDVAGIVEVSKLPFLPGRKGFVSGIISLRGEPVTVADLKKAFGLDPGENGAHKIIVLRDAACTLGLDAGGAEVSFIWAEGLKDKTVTEKVLGYVKGTIETDEGPIGLVDWKRIFEDAAKLLSVADGMRA
ncbi:MAG: chemotaxis protein CheW [Deltaproteobacteria bacterium]|nr:chemotaxis protein CheW [Deltaproteobacteria bacterium]